jgi:Right handed beta helix region
MRMKPVLTLLCTLALLFTPPVVSTAQSDCPEPTPLGPGKTYRMAPGQGTSLPALKPGDNVLFQRGGVYHMRSKIAPPSGAAGRPILFGAYGTGPRPVLDGSGASQGPYARAFEFRGDTDVILDGLELRHYGSPIVITHGRRITIRRSVIGQTRGPCMMIAKDSSEILIEGNEIGPCGSSVNGEGIYVGTDPANTSSPDRSRDVTIRYNTIRQTKDEAIEFKPGTSAGKMLYNLIEDSRIGINLADWNGDSLRTQHLVEGNVVTRIDLSGRSRGQAANGIVTRAGAIIRRNVVAGTRGAPGIHVYQPRGAAQTFVVERNTVYSTEKPGIVVRTSGVSERQNLVYRTGGGNFPNDPLFTAPDRLNFTLRPGSPAAGLGAYAMGESWWPVGADACGGDGGRGETPP